MRTLEEIAEDYWKTYAEYDDEEELHKQKIENFKCKLSIIFQEFDTVRKHIGKEETSLADTNPYRKFS